MITHGEITVPFTALLKFAYLHFPSVRRVVGQNPTCRERNSKITWYFLKPIKKARAASHDVNACVTIASCPRRGHRASGRSLWLRNRPYSLAPATSTSTKTTSTPRTPSASAVASDTSARTAATVRTVVSRALRTTTACRPIAIECIHRTAIDLAGPVGGLTRSFTCGSLRLPRAIVQHAVSHGVVLLRSVHIIPTATVPLGPVAALIAAVHVPVSAGVNVLSATADEATAVWSTTRDHASLISACNTRRISRAVGKSLGVGPIVTTLHVCGSPTAIDVRSLSSGCVSTSARVISLRRTARSVGSIGKGAPSVRSGARVVARAKTGTSVWSVNSSGCPVNAGVGVVPGAITISAPVWVINRVITAVPVIGRLIPASPPDGASPSDHHAGIAGGGRIRNPVVIGILVFLDRDVGNAMSRRVGGNLIDFFRH